MIAATEKPAPCARRRLVVHRVEDLRPHLDRRAGQAVVRLAARRPPADRPAPPRRGDRAPAGSPRPRRRPAWRRRRTSTPRRRRPAERHRGLLQAQGVHRLVQDVLQAVQLQVLGAAALQDLADPDVLQPRQRVDETSVQPTVRDDAFQQVARARRVFVARAGIDVLAHCSRAAYADLTTRRNPCSSRQRGGVGRKAAGREAPVAGAGDRAQGEEVAGRDHRHRRPGRLRLEGPGRGGRALRRARGRRVLDLRLLPHPRRDVRRHPRRWAGTRAPTTRATAPRSAANEYLQNQAEREGAARAQAPDAASGAKPDPAAALAARRRDPVRRRDHPHHVAGGGGDGRRPDLRRAGRRAGHRPAVAAGARGDRRRCPTRNAS